MGNQLEFQIILKYLIIIVMASIPSMSRQPMTVCEEVQNAQLDNNEVNIEYITDAQGNRVKKLKPVFIKSDPDREHILCVDGDDNLPAVSE